MAGAFLCAHLGVPGRLQHAEYLANWLQLPTAKGFAFWLLEDNVERTQVVISPDLWERQWQTLRDARILLTEGLLSRQGRAWTLRAEGLARVV